MKRVLTMFVILACILSVVGGHFYYNNKLEEIAQAAKLELEMVQKEDTTMKVSSEESQKPSEDHFKNAPKGIAELYKQKKDAGKALTFHLIGSTNTSMEDGTWAKLFATQMTDTYGENVNVFITSLGKMTSLELQNNQVYSDVIKKKADIVLIEPVLLNDNIGIRMDDTLFVLGKMIAGIKAANPEAIILLQPSNPINSPNKYAVQIKELKKYAQEQNIPYLNHWDSWPSVESEDIKEYYNITTLLPNEKGYKVWADYMNNLFK
ncbi:SGNH/GDSL hydrolase family protein [Fictibacillus nanhaiensis]|uniref:SGNH/GDSL hydrolase family protein n=1 Tax=Fictibacillus nanhaiensis TaxID=742169 RepID=UPI001C962B0A|nr:SGNH/GDSL hydrolase family protein [Fictibacillus nanhaiensis]MBY6037121.1 SGNH/GDSL hydrolase family protein [Fictibacillus nanhaiensis]